MADYKEYKTITGKVLSVEPIQDIEVKGKKHKRWAVMVSTQDGGEMKILVVDWDDTGTCPLKPGETQTIRYKDWTSSQGITYHNYVAPRKSGGGSRSGSAPLRMIISKKVGDYEYRVEVAGGLTQAADAANIAHQAIQILTRGAASVPIGGEATNTAAQPVGAPDDVSFPEDEVPFEQNPRIMLIRRYAGGKSLKQVFYDAWQAGVVSRIVTPDKADDLELQRIAEWLRDYRRTELPLYGEDK